MPHILIIDDEDQIRNMLQILFERAGYEVSVAKNGLEALKGHARTPADLIVTDIIMPEQEGLETIRKIREDLSDVKIIAISGGGIGGAESYLSLAAKLGADITFKKPVEHRDLLEAVRKLIGNDK